MHISQNIVKIENATNDIYKIIEAIRFRHATAQIQETLGVEKAAFAMDEVDGATRYAVVESDGPILVWKIVSRAYIDNEDPWIGAYGASHLAPNGTLYFTSFNRITPELGQRLEAIYAEVQGWVKEVKGLS